jgi:hypothetical protein
MDLPEKELIKIHKVLNLFILGEFFGYHNLLQLLERCHIKSHNLYNIWRQFSTEQIVYIAEFFFWINFRAKMIELCSKSDSTWSRMNVTLVIDTSIYKQILSNGEEIEEYDKFFSGQYNCVVYGFRLTLIGVVIDKTFYPIRFVISSKKEKEIDVAERLYKEVAEKIETLKEDEEIDFPNLFLSVDNGFCQKKLFDAVADIDVISVPKKSWIFEIDGKRQNLRAHIKEYLKEEEKSDTPILPLRKRAKCNVLGEVVVLFFRYNGKKKVNVIVTTKLDIFAKTLRHRWFQRTYIEQFFRFSKHTLKIQETKSTDKKEFEKKLSINFLKAIVCQEFTQFCRKNYKILDNFSFHKIRKNLIRGQIDQVFLESILFDYEGLFHDLISINP